jgi:hypothetical protein
VRRKYQKEVGREIHRKRERVRERSEVGEDTYWEERSDWTRLSQRCKIMQI